VLRAAAIEPEQGFGRPPFAALFGMDAAGVQAALEAARNRTVAGGARGPAPQAKFAKGRGKGKATPQNDAAVLQVLVRDHLFLRQSHQELLNAKTIVCIAKSDAHHAELKGIADAWHENKAAQQQDGYQGVKLPVKKVFMFSAWMSLYSRVAKEQNQDAAIGMALEQLAKLPPAEADLYIGSFRSQYNSPMSGRAWKWTLILSDFCPSLFTELMRQGLNFKDMSSPPSLTLAPQRGSQSEPERAMWEWLKQSRPGGTAYGSDRR